MSASSPIVDTYPSFLGAIQVEKPVSLDDWLSCWSEQYMPHWPALHEMVLNDYAEQGDDWRQIAREHVFPGMNDKLPTIDRAYRNLRRIIQPIEQKVRDVLDFHAPLRYVIYIGLGNGAGWVTKYEGNWAVLFGLEGIVDSGFDARPSLEGLVAHELGHVVHFTWREAHGLSDGTGPWWQLYEEGFAQRCEAETLPGDSWHMRHSLPGDDWLAWCRANRAWLAAEFLRTVDEGQSIRPFFGSWYELKGRKQTGYFLGQQVIDRLSETMSLKDIALLGSGVALEHSMRRVVAEFAATPA